MKLQELFYQYSDQLPHPAVDRITFEFEHNRAYSIVGTSGCGKTTLLYCLAGILVPTRGMVILNDSGEKPGLMTQKNSLLPWKTVRDNIELGLLAQKLPKNERENRSSAILEELGLTDLADRYPSELSGGQLQRAALARTLVVNPPILLMDEPTSQLDQMTKEDVQDTIRQQFLSHPRIMILVTHSIEEALYLGQEVFIMDRGRFVSRFTNPLFVNEDPRMTREFYDLAREVRAGLRGRP